MEDKWEMKPPYKIGDEYWLLTCFGGFQKKEWTNNLFDEIVSVQGNTFPTQEAIELEIKRRKLLTRFRAFRDECNNGWKPDFGEKCKTSKFLIAYSWDSKDDQYKLKPLELGSSNLFNQFGYFKNKQDAERAIELFGGEIKELFVDCEE